MMSEGMVDVSSSESGSVEEGEMISPGILREAAVEGLMSWCGEGWRFMLTDWIAEASSMAGLWDIVMDWVWSRGLCGRIVDGRRREWLPSLVVRRRP